MDGGGTAALVIFLLLVVAISVGCWWHRRRIRLQQEHFIAWAGEQLTLKGKVLRSNDHRSNSEDSLTLTSSIDNSHGRARGLSDLSNISLDGETNCVPGKVDFTMFRNEALGISINFPKGWRQEERKSTTGSTLYQFVVPQGESIYKRLSIAVDDVCWSRISPRIFARHVISSLPEEFPGSKILSERPSKDGSGYEVVYNIPEANDVEDPSLCNQLTILSYYCIGNTWAFTVAFAIDAGAFDRYEGLARELVGSFRIAHLAKYRASHTTETSDDPSKVAWKRLRATKKTLGGATLIHPKHWQSEVVPNPRVIRYCCSRSEQVFKVRVFPGKISRKNFQEKFPGILHHSSPCSLQNLLY